jgi:hypothetical protein
MKANFILVLIKKTRISVLLLSLICFYTEGYSQRGIEPKESFSDRLFYGGNFGLMFGTITYVELSPLVGYRITERLSAGPGISYIYLQDNMYNLSTSIYGGRLFTRYNITDYLFGHGEYEVLNRDSFNPLEGRVNVTNLLLGGGYRQRLGENSFLSIMGLWNFNESAYSIYRNPIIRMGFSAGF